VRMGYRVFFVMWYFDLCLLNGSVVLLKVM